MKTYTDRQEQVLKNRTLHYDIKDGLKPTIDKLPNPYSLLNAKEGSELLIKHIEANSKIIIFTDYDADGVLSAGLGHRAFIDHYNYSNFIVIVNEKKYGNGLNKTMLNKIKNLYKDGFTLLITADHGSANESAFKELKEVGYDLLITDHHLIPEDNFPHSADVFINPQQKGCSYSKNISGCTTFLVFLYVTYLELEKTNYNLKKKDNMVSLLPFAAISTLSDAMDMRDIVNRTYVHNGLKVLNNDDSVIWELIRNNTLGALFFTENDVSFNIASLLNSPHRLDKAYESFLFLKSETKEEAFIRYNKLLDINKERKVLQSELSTKVNVQIPKYLKRYKHSLITIIPDSSGIGIGGLVAGNLSEKYERPTVCFTKVDDTYVGSCRAGVMNYNASEGLKYIREEDNIVIKGGGHTGVFGCEIHGDKLIAFMDRFEESVRIQDVKLERDTAYDIELDNKDINLALYDELEQLSPFGNYFPAPLLKSKFKLKFNMKVGNGKEHMLGTLITDDDNELKFFHMGGGLEDYKKDSMVEIIYNLGLDYYNGTYSLKIMVKTLISAF